MTVKKKVQLRPDLGSIGRRIRQIRGFDLSQAEFGKILGVSQRQLSKYESGESAPTLEVLLRLSAYSGKSIDSLIKGGEEV